MPQTKICSTCGAEKPATVEYYIVGKRYTDGLRGQCRECLKKQNKAYKQRTKEHIIEISKIYNDAHKKQRAQYRAENAERLLKYRNDNKERISQWGKEYRKSQNAKDRRRANQERREARKADLPATLTNQQWENCKKYFNNGCAYCGKHDTLQQEHVHPLSKGGAYTADNIIPSCQRCNVSKHDKFLADWYPKQKYYSKKREQAIYSYLNQNYIGEQSTFDIPSLWA